MLCYIFIDMVATAANSMSAQHILTGILECGTKGAMH